MTPTDNPKLTVINGHAYATSIEVARRFNKTHDYVLKVIRRTLEDCSSGFNLVNFDEIKRRDSRNREQPIFNLTRDGFAVIAMAFTGKEAMAWKEAFLAEFNRMETELSRYSLRDGVIRQASLFPDINLELHNQRPALTVTAAVTLLAYHNLNIPPVSRNSIISAIKRNRLEGFRGASGWMIYEDSFTAWMQARRQGLEVRHAA